MNWDIDLAVKTPRPEYFRTDAHKQNFIRECETWINLGLHPHIVSCYYVRDFGGIPRVFAEYVDGGSLKDWIASGTLYEGGQDKALERILDIAIQFAWGIQYAHEQGLTHQDIKPANVMMTLEGVPKVTDFGLANVRAVETEGAKPADGKSVLASFAGMTPAYSSPEQAENAERDRAGVPRNEWTKLTRQTDIYSWAVSVFEMFTGEVTWPVGNVVGHIFDSYISDVDESQKLCRVSDTLADLLKRCLSDKAQDRPKSLQDVANVLVDIYRNEIGVLYSREQPTAADLLADSLNNRALSLWELDRVEQAKQYFGEALAIDPQHPAVVYNRGLMLWRLAEITDFELITSLEAILKSTHRSSDSLLKLGLVHLERSDVSTALSLFKEARELEETPSLVAHVNMAESNLGDSVRCVNTLVGHKEGVSAACITNESTHLISGSIDGSIRIWDIESARCLRTLPAQERVVDALHVGRSGKMLVAITSSRKVRLWNLSTRSVVCELCADLPGVRCVYLSADDSWILTGGGKLNEESGENTIRIWDTSSGNLIRTFAGSAFAVSSICCTRDERTIITTSANPDVVKLWDQESGRCTQMLEGHEDWVNSLSLDATERHLLSGSHDRTMRLWDLTSGNCVRVFREHSAPVQTVALSRDGRWALSGSGHGQGRYCTARLWEVGSGRCIRTLERKTTQFGVISFALGDRFAVCACHGDLGNVSDPAIWNVSRFTQTQKLSNLAAPALSKITLRDELSSIAAEFDVLAASARDYLARHDYGAALQSARSARSLAGHKRKAEILDLWALLGKHCPRTTLNDSWQAREVFIGASVENRPGLSNTPHVVRFLQDGSSAIVAVGDGSIREIALDTGECRHHVEEHSNWVLSLSLDRSSSVALTASTDDTMKLWDLSRFKCIKTIVTSSAISCIGPGVQYAFSGDGREVVMWDLETSTIIRRFVGHTQNVRAICVNARGNLVATGGGLGNKGTEIRVWDVTSGRCLCSLSGHSGIVRDLCFGSNSEELLSACADHSLRMWDVSNGTCKRIFEGHTDSVVCAAVSSDGRWVVSGSWDETVRVWDASSAQCLAILDGHRSYLCSVCLSEDLRWILSSDSDGVVKLWELDWELEET